MSKKIYSFKSNYRSNSTSFRSKGMVFYYLAAFFEKVSYFILIMISVVMMNFSVSNSNIINLLRKNVLFISRPIFMIAELPFNALFDVINCTKNIVLTTIKNRQLTQENIILRKLYFESKDIARENENLKKMLNFKNGIEENYNYITTRVYNTSKNGMNNLVTIKLGKEEGIKEGSLVLGVNRTAVGRVVNVLDGYSTILFLNDINSRIPARTVQTQEKVILSGNNEGHLVISYYNSKNPEIIDGDEVLTSGDSDIIPDGFLIGKIKKNENEISIEMEEDTSTLFNLMILLPKEPQEQVIEN